MWISQNTKCLWFISFIAFFSTGAIVWNKSNCLLGWQVPQPIPNTLPGRVFGGKCGLDLSTCSSRSTFSVQMRLLTYLIISTYQYCSLKIKFGKIRVNNWIIQNSTAKFYPIYYVMILEYSLFIVSGLNLAVIG